MSYNPRRSPSAPTTKKVVNRSTFVTMLIILIILMVVFLALAIVFFYLYRKTLGNLQNNICPVTH